MKVTQIEKLNQLISRTDMTGNQKVEWLTNFIDEYVTEQLRLHNVVKSLPNEEEVKAHIDKLKIENHEILKRRPDLRINGDFTEDGEKLHSNVSAMSSGGFGTTHYQNTTNVNRISIRRNKI